jgi:hypothetical protein
MQREQRLRDTRVIRREGKRSAQDALLTATGQRVENLLCLFVHVLALEVGQARPRIGIEVSRQLRRRLRRGQDGRRGQRRERSHQAQVPGTGHRVASSSVSFSKSRAHYGPG